MKNKLLTLLKKKPLRYITSKYLDNKLYQKILNKTSFLNNIELSERIYCIINNVSEHPKCPYCRKNVPTTFKGINMDVNKYLNKYCSISMQEGNFNITGIAGKLLKYFERNYKPNKIIIYADRRWSQGNLYYQLGFKFSHVSQPNYWYIHLSQ